MATAKRSFITAALLALLAACSPAQQPAGSPKPVAKAPEHSADGLRDAESLLQGQKYSEAAEKLQIAVSRQPRNPQAWFDLGYAQSHLGRTPEAVAAYRKAVELSPGWFEANLNLGLALARSGDFADAATVLKHTVELKPTSGGQAELSNAWDSLGQVLEQSDPKAAAQAFRRGAELNPANPGIAVDAGRALEKAGDLASAEQQFREAADAGNAQGMAMLINLLSRQQRYQEAESWLRKYVVRSPQDQQARIQLARLLASQGRQQEAIEILQAQPGAASNPESEREMAHLYLQTKQYRQAEPLFRNLLKGSPSDPDLHLGLGVSVLYQLKYAEAETELLEAVKLKPDEGDAYGYLADAARESKHYELAIRALDARARFLPEDAKTYFVRATSYDNLRVPRQAVQYYKKFLAVAQGRYPDQEFQARHRLKALQPE